MAISEDSFREIMLALGRLEEGMERQREDFESEKIETRQSRLSTSNKLDKIEEDVAIVGKTAAQARDKADSVERVVIDDVRPVTDEIKRAKLKGIGALWAVGIIATLFGVSIASIGEHAINLIRSFLRIP